MPILTIGLIREAHVFSHTVEGGKTHQSILRMGSPADWIGQVVRGYFQVRAFRWGTGHSLGGPAASFLEQPESGFSRRQPLEPGFREPGVMGNRGRDRLPEFCLTDFERVAGSSGGENFGEQKSSG